MRMIVRYVKVRYPVKGATGRFPVQKVYLSTAAIFNAKLHHAGKLIKSI